jgi:hypothetical protein
MTILTRIFIFTCTLITWTQFDAVAQKDSTLLKPKKPDSLIYWKNSGAFRMNFRNVTLKNWNAGGSSNIALGGEFRYAANYKKGDHSWNNTFLFAYGLIREANSDFPFKKNDDRILMNSKYSRKLNGVWSLSSIVDFRTQFDRGYRYRRLPNTDTEQRTFLSKFMAPGYLQGSLGLTYKGSDWYALTLSPYTGKLTFVWDDSLSRAGAFGVEKGEKSRLEAGSSITTSLKKTIMENVKLSSNLNLFAGYESMDKVDVNWEALLELRVNKFISSSISAQLIYDEDIRVRRDDGTEGPAVQFQNVINIGFILDIGSK